MTKTRPPIQRQRPCELRIDIESCPSSSCSLDLPASMGEGSPITHDPNSLSPLYPMLHSATTGCEDSPGRAGSACSGGSGASGAGGGRLSAASSGSGRGGVGASSNGRVPAGSARRRRSIWAAAQALQQLRKARERHRGGRRGSFIPLSMLRHAPFSFSNSSATAAVPAQPAALNLTAPDWRPGRVQLIANRSASQDRRDRGRREREECKKMALACYAVVCCVGAYALFSYVAFFMNG